MFLKYPKISYPNLGDILHVQRIPSNDMRISFRYLADTSEIGRRGNLRLPACERVLKSGV